MLQGEKGQKVAAARRYECVTCGRSPSRSDGSDATRPLRVADCETCGEPVCELCAPDHAAICARFQTSLGSSLGDRPRRQIL